MINCCHKNDLQISRFCHLSFPYSIWCLYTFNLGCEHSVRKISHWTNQSHIANYARKIYLNFQKTMLNLYRFFAFGSGKAQMKRQTPSPKSPRRSTSSDREVNSDFSGDSPIHTINSPMHSYSTGNLKDMDMKQTPTSSR